MIYFLRGKDGTYNAQIIDIAFDDFDAMDRWEVEIEAMGEVVVGAIRVPQTSAGRTLMALCALHSEGEDSFLRLIESLLTDARRPQIDMDKTWSYRPEGHRRSAQKRHQWDGLGERAPG